MSRGDVGYFRCEWQHVLADTAAESAVRKVRDPVVQARSLACWKG